MTDAHNETKIMVVVICNEIERCGRTTVTTPQAIAINTVFEPGMSLRPSIFRPILRGPGNSLTL